MIKKINNMKNENIKTELRRIIASSDIDKALYYLTLELTQFNVKKTIKDYHTLQEIERLKNEVAHFKLLLKHYTDTLKI